MNQTHYELGARQHFPALTAGLAWKVGDAIEGVSVWARDEHTGEYVRVYETGPEEGGWVQGEHHGHWTRGNFETLAEAKRMASVVYRKLNRGRRAV